MFFFFFSSRERERQSIQKHGKKITCSLFPSLRSPSHIVSPLGELDRGVDDEALGSCFFEFGQSEQGKRERESEHSRSIDGSAIESQRWHQLSPPRQLRTSQPEVRVAEGDAKGSRA